MKVKNGLIMAAIPAAIFVQNAEAAKTPNRPSSHPVFNLEITFP